MCAAWGLPGSSEDRWKASWGSPNPNFVPNILQPRPHSLPLKSHFGIHCPIYLMPYFINALLPSPRQDPGFFRFASWAVLTAEIKLTKQRT